MKKIERQIIETIGKHANDLLNENWPSISEMLEDVPDGKINIGLAVALDWSEAAPKVKTTISYSRKWKDEREDELDDPNQPRLPLPGDATALQGDLEPDFATNTPEGDPPANNGAKPRRKASRKLESA